MENGIIFDIKRYAIHDGPGIRTTIFLKGCPASCWWCHNPESQQPQIQPIIDENRFDDRIFCEERTIGTLMSVSEVISEVLRDRIFYDESGGGITFSGGEPLFQYDFLFALLNRCRQQKLHTTLDTSGYCDPADFKSISHLIDLFLYDIKFIDTYQHIKYTGVSNINILENLSWLAGQGKPVRLRFPLIPGITATRKNIREITAFIKNLNLPKPVIDLLPYHRIAAHKYRRLNMPDLMAAKAALPDGLVAEIRTVLERSGLKVYIGG